MSCYLQVNPLSGNKASDIFRHSVSEATFTRNRTFKELCPLWTGFDAHATHVSWSQLGLIGNICTIVPIAVLVVDDEQHYAKKKADGANGYVGYAQEWIFSSHPRYGAQDHAFSPIKATHRII